ncbi:MAG TPA: hypothetical protein VI546_01520, partial [candidate division Zixibacteria bacterium]|nr:hypothetical protein [candidate division Zixibacteria bacterium]
VFITNKDSLTALTLALEERSGSGGAYAILGYPRSFTGVVNRLTETLGGSRVFSVGNGPGSRYNGKSPDSMLIAGLFDPMEPATIEPPNRVRKAFWEIKFDTVWAPAGKVEIDTARVVQSTGFTTTNPRDLPVNFVKGVLTVAPKGKPKK